MLRSEHYVWPDSGWKRGTHSFLSAPLLLRGPCLAYPAETGTRPLQPTRGGSSRQEPRRAQTSQCVAASVPTRYIPLPPPRFSNFQPSPLHTLFASQPCPRPCFQTARVVGEVQDSWRHLPSSDFRQRGSLTVRVCLSLTASSTVSMTMPSLALSRPRRASVCLAACVRAGLALALASLVDVPLLPFACAQSGDRFKNLCQRAARRKRQAALQLNLKMAMALLRRQHLAPHTVTVLTCFLLSVCLTHSSFAFPVYVASNGTTYVNSAFGSNLVLGPDPGGNVVALALLNASAGVQLNSTLLNEPLVQNLLARVAQLSTTVTTLMPPACGPPGGSLQWSGTTWICNCIPGWSGASCAVQPNYWATCSSTVRQWPLNSTYPTAELITSATVNAAKTGGTVRFSNSQYITGSMEFDGTSTYATLPSIPITQSDLPFSISFWVRGDSTFAGNVFSWAITNVNGGTNTPPTSSGWIFALYGAENLGAGTNSWYTPTPGLWWGAAPCWMPDVGANSQFLGKHATYNSSTGLANGYWNHFVLTFSDNTDPLGNCPYCSNVHMYLNGEQVPVGPLWAPPPYTSGCWIRMNNFPNQAAININLGGNIFSDSQGQIYSTIFFLGAVTNFQVMNTELSPSAVQRLYNGQPC